MQSISKAGTRLLAKNIKDRFTSSRELLPALRLVLPIGTHPRPPLFGKYSISKELRRRVRRESVSSGCAKIQETHKENNTDEREKRMDDQVDR